MKKQGFWFTVISYILANWFGYHLSKMPTKGVGRKKRDAGIPYPQEEGEYPKSGE